jgi:hypothetical protein
VTVEETCGLSGYGVRQPIELKYEVVPRTPNPTYSYSELPLGWHPVEG